MKLIKRLTASVSATLDNAVSQIENHDAIVEATIQQTRQAVAKTTARINTLRQQQTVYEEQLKDVQEQRHLWAERATRLASSDEQKALQCVARRNQCSTEIKRLQVAIPQQKRLIDQVVTNLHKLEAKSAEITQRHNLMRSRQTVADVNRVVGCASNDNDLLDIFERWESSILEHELSTTIEFVVDDPLGKELSQQENEQDLNAQLKALVSDGEKGNE